MERDLIPYIQKDIPRKIILLSGARQCGKTTLAKMIKPSYEYINYDDREHRIILLEQSWDRAKPLLILDELHKMKQWKSWLKGVYDTEGLKPPIIVTGSARLDTYRKTGDSLAGRFFLFRLHPLDLKEILSVMKKQNAEKVFERLLGVGGFPEPYLEGTKSYYNRWRRSHLDIILRQDLLEIENIQNIVQVETLVELLRQRVGSPISFTSLAEDLKVSDKTIKRWLMLLENLYIVFKITPYHRNIARALQKSSKYYFFDSGQVLGDEGIRFENLVACALLKEVHFRMDCLGENWQLNYARTRDGKETDFVLTGEKGNLTFIESKLSDDRLDSSLRYFVERQKAAKGIQLVYKLNKEKTYSGNLEVRNAVTWLSQMSF